MEEDSSDARSHTFLLNSCNRLSHLFPLWLLLLLGACGDGGGDSLPGATQLRAQEVASPLVTGDVATDGLSWINFRRQQAGLLPLARDPVLDQAARAHAEYQSINQSIAHEEHPGRQGFTGLDAPRGCRQQVSR